MGIAFVETSDENQSRSRELRHHHSTDRDHGGIASSFPAGAPLSALPTITNREKGKRWSNSAPHPCNRVWTGTQFYSASDRLIATQLMPLWIGRHFVVGREARGEGGVEWRGGDLELGRWARVGGGSSTSRRF
jgi:hypothetical protein